MCLKKNKNKNTPWSTVYLIRVRVRSFHLVVLGELELGVVLVVGGVTATPAPTLPAILTEYILIPKYDY